MKKLNLRKIRWILKELEKAELSVYQIAKQQGITPRWARELPKKYRETKPYKIKIRKPGRPPEPISDEEKKMVLNLYEFMPMCAVKIEKHLAWKRMEHIPHNRIHRILLGAGKVKQIKKKIRRKKWVRYERRHSNSLWHADYCEIDGRHLISYIDDASRFIVGYGMFNEATTDNALAVFNSSAQRNGLPKQVMTDHGTQFCADEKKTYRFSDTLKAKGVQHIMAKVKRPQSNGKEERWFGTIKRIYCHFGKDLNKAVACYNQMFHLSIDTSPEEAYARKRRNN